MKKENGRYPIVAMVLGCLLCLMPLQSLWAASYCTENIPSCRIRVKASSEEACASLAHFLSICSSHVDKLLGVSRFPDKLLTVKILQADDPRSETTVNQLVIEPTMSMVQVVYNIYGALLLRREAELSSASDAKKELGGKGVRFMDKPMVQWMAAGLCHRMLLQEMGGAGVMACDYEVARNLYGDGRYPCVDVLLNGGFDVSHEAFFEVYMLHCDVLLASLESVRGSLNEPFMALLKRDRDGAEPTDGFDSVFKSFYEGGTRQSFYERRVNLVIKRLHRGLNVALIEEKVRDLETISVVGGGAEALKRVRLEDMPALLEDYKTDKRALVKLELQFASVRDEAPYWLHEPLNQYIAALDLLCRGKMRAFKRDFKRAREAFQSALKKQYELETFMDDEEHRLRGIHNRFDDFLRIIDHYHQLAGQVYPGGDIFP